MKIELVKKIKEIIAAYQANNEQSIKEIKKIIDEWKDKVNQYRDDFLHQTLTEGLTEISDDSKKVNKVYNQKLKAVIEEAKKLMLPMMIKPVKRPSDYATKVSNTIEYLKLEGEEITDNSAYMYLKDFIDDYDQMKLFKNVIEKLIKRVNPFGLTNAEGKTTFPKTFGKLNQVEVVLNTFNEMEAIANMLFLYGKETDQTYFINGHGYVLPMEGLDEEMDEATILNQAAVVESIAKEVPGVETITDQTDHETVES